MVRALSREAQVEYEKGLLLMYVGAPLGVAGFGLATYGALEEMRYCPYCGAPVKPDYQFCSMCVRKLK